MSKPILTIGVPCHRDVDPTWAYMFKLLRVPDGFDGWQLLMPRGMPVDEARNYIVDQMKGEYLFFLDSDVLPPADAIEKLLAHDKDVVTGLYFQRNPPFWPHIYKESEAPGRYDSLIYYDEKKNEQGERQTLLEVASAGLGCCLIKSSVFDKIGTIEENEPKPWFKFTTGWGKETRESEDHFFFRRCREEGIKIFADTTVVCGHIDRDIVTEKHWLSMREDAFPKNKPKMPAPSEEPNIIR